MAEIAASPQYEPPQAAEQIAYEYARLLLDHLYDWSTTNPSSAEDFNNYMLMQRGVLDKDANLLAEAQEIVMARCDPRTSVRRGSSEDQFA